MKSNDKTFPYSQVLTRPILGTSSKLVAELAQTGTITIALSAISYLGLLVIATSAFAHGGQSFGSSSSSQSNAGMQNAGGPAGWSNTTPPYSNPDAAKGRPLRFNSNFPRGAGVSLPKGAIHLVVRSDADARQIFRYYTFPWVAAKPGAVGVYRLEVDPQGNVQAVTILKSLGPQRDIRVMKTCVGWRAKPGPLRVVDISWVMSA